MEKEEVMKASQFISKGKVKREEFITEVISLEKIKEGIKKVKSGEVLKCVVEI